MRCHVQADDIIGVGGRNSNHGARGDGWPDRAGRSTPSRLISEKGLGPPGDGGLRSKLQRGAGSRKRAEVHGFQSCPSADILKSVSRCTMRPEGRGGLAKRGLPRLGDYRVADKHVRISKSTWLTMGNAGVPLPTKRGSQRVGPREKGIREHLDTVPLFRTQDMHGKTSARSNQMKAVSHPVERGDPRSRKSKALGVTESASQRIPPGIFTKDELLRAIGITRPQPGDTGVLHSKR